MITRSSSLFTAQTIRPSAQSLRIPPGYPSPADFGLPSQFTDWRPAQLDAVNRIIDSKKRFIVICLPTGGGKSAIPMALSLMSGLRSVTLTSTLGLADQYKNSFEDIATDIRGMANYRCVIAPNVGLSHNTNVADAPCQHGQRCPLRFGGCLYFDAYRKARESDIITTTYQCWMYDALKDPREALHNTNIDSDPDSPFPNAIVDLLIADEAGSAVFELERFISVYLSRRECLQLHIDWPDHRYLPQWIEWANVTAPQIRARIVRIEQAIKSGNGNGNGDGNGNGNGTSHSPGRELKNLRELSRKLDRLSTIQPEDRWVMAPRNHEDASPNDDPISIEFIPVEPAKFAEQSLWRKVKKIVLMSATIRPKTAEMLGIPASEMEFIEYPSTFPVSRRPVIVVPTVMMNFRSEQNDDLMMKWLHRIDAIIAGRLDRKGIIHVMSYSRGRFLFDNSEHRDLILIHGRSDRARIIQEFIDSPAPRVLVSPSISKGYDFKDDLARYAIIAKLPFQTVTDPVTKARQELDPEYGTYLTAQEIIQESGRVCRSESDYGEVLIIDDSFGNWFYRRARKFFPEWWNEAVIFSDGLRPAMKLDPTLS